jgi:hypothetical protein
MLDIPCLLATAGLPVGDAEQHGSGAERSM